MGGFLRRNRVQSREIENPWIVRVDGIEMRFPDLRPALTKAIELLPLPPKDSADEAVAHVIEERHKGLRGRLEERLEMTLTVSSRGLAVVLNRNRLSLRPYGRRTLETQPAEKVAHVILIERAKDNAIVGH